MSGRQWRSQGHCFGGGASSEPRKHSRGSAPNFYTDVDFSNGLEPNWRGRRPPPHPWGATGTTPLLAEAQNSKHFLRVDLLHDPTNELILSR